MRKVELPKKTIKALKENGIDPNDVRIFPFSAMAEFSDLFLNGEDYDVTSVLAEHKEDIIDYLKGEVSFVDELEPLFYIHIVDGDKGYINLNDGDIYVTDKCSTVSFKTKFTKDEALKLNPAYEAFLEPIEVSCPSPATDDDIETSNSSHDEPLFYIMDEDNEFYNQCTDDKNNIMWNTHDETDVWKTKFTVSEVNEFDLNVDYELIPVFGDTPPKHIVGDTFYITRKFEDGSEEFLNKNVNNDYYTFSTIKESSVWKTKFNSQTLSEIPVGFLKETKILFTQDFD